MFSSFRRTWLACVLFLALGAGQAFAQPMATGLNGWTVSDPLLTIGQEINGYTPVGILDGLGAYELDDDTVRVLANHELLHFRGNEYELSGGAYTLQGARVSHFDIDKDTRQIVDAGLAIQNIYDANFDLVTDSSFLGTPYAPAFGDSSSAAPFLGLSRLCSSSVFEPSSFGPYRGLRDRIYMTGEEDGGGFNSVGGAQWALDPDTGDLWQLPYFGRGAWENVTEISTGNPFTVAFILADDSSPFDADDDGITEAAPLYLYVGFKRWRPNANFVKRNGLDRGLLFVFVSETGETSPADFNGSGTIAGRWKIVNNRRRPGLADPTGESGYDLNGFPTQRNLWIQAENRGAFGFSRPEDVATNPDNPSECVLASTGVDTFVGGADTFGTIYTIDTHFPSLTATLTIIYDGDADPTRALRSPDNLDWADDGYIYIQEDEAEEFSPSGEQLFGPMAVNPNEAGIVRVDPVTGDTLRVANIDRSVVLDASLADPTLAVDVDAGAAGEWETSGILDVSTLFGEAPGTLFLFDVQAHGIEDQTDFNPLSRLNDGDLVEGGQLLFLEAPSP